MPVMMSSKPVNRRRSQRLIDLKSKQEHEIQGPQPARDLLPVEIWCNILARLPDHCVVPAAHTCRLFAAHFHKSPVLVDRVRIETSKPSSPNVLQLQPLNTELSIVYKKREVIPGREEIGAEKYDDETYVEEYERRTTNSDWKLRVKSSVLEAGKTPEGDTSRRVIVNKSIKDTSLFIQPVDSLGNVPAFSLSSVRLFKTENFIVDFSMGSFVAPPNGIVRPFSSQSLCFYCTHQTFPLFGHWLRFTVPSEELKLSVNGNRSEGPTSTVPIVPFHRTGKVEDSPITVASMDIELKMFIVRKKREEGDITYVPQRGPTDDDEDMDEDAGQVSPSSRSRRRMKRTVKELEKMKLDDGIDIGNKKEQKEEEVQSAEESVVATLTDLFERVVVTESVKITCKGLTDIFAVLWKIIPKWHRGEVEATIELEAKVRLPFAGKLNRVTSELLTHLSDLFPRSRYVMHKLLNNVRYYNTWILLDKSTKLPERFLFVTSDNRRAENCSLKLRSYTKSDEEADMLEKLRKGRKVTGEVADADQRWLKR